MSWLPGRRKSIESLLEHVNILQHSLSRPKKTACHDIICNHAVSTIFFFHQIRIIKDIFGHCPRFSIILIIIIKSNSLVYDIIMCHRSVRRPGGALAGILYTLFHNGRHDHPIETNGLCLHVILYQPDNKVHVRYALYLHESFKRHY